MKVVQNSRSKKVEKRKIERNKNPVYTQKYVRMRLKIQEKSDKKLNSIGPYL